MRVHELKTWPQYWDDVAGGKKPFEIRQNDRDFRVGDYLLLRKWDPKTEAYIDPDRCWLVRRVSYMTDAGCPFLPANFVVMAMVKVRPDIAHRAKRVAGGSW